MQDLEFYCRIRVILEKNRNTSLASDLLSEVRKLTTIRAAAAGVTAASAAEVRISQAWFRAGSSPIAQSRRPCSSSFCWWLGRRVDRASPASPLRQDWFLTSTPSISSLDTWLTPHCGLPQYYGNVIVAGSTARIS